MTGRAGGLRHIRILAFALVLAFTLKVFVVDAVTVPTRSMEPGILPGDCILLDKTGFSPSFIASRLPARGDVVAFERSGAGEGGAPGRVMLKRCVAVAGDSVEYRDGMIVVNGIVAVAGVSDGGELFAEGAARRVPRAGEAVTNGGPGAGTAGRDYIFVMGDNSAVSLDSRTWGFVPARSVIGKAAMIYWSRGADGAVRWSRIGNLVR